METTYAGAFQIFSNAYDIKIDFSSVEPQVDENGDVVRDVKVLKSRIAMSPTLAKELSQILPDVVKNYEEKFGVIPDLSNTSEE